MVPTYAKLIAEWHAIGEFLDFAQAHPSNGENRVYDLQIKLLHTNYLIWHHEDLCRSGVPELIVENKVKIDKLNQLRNNLIEALDSLYLSTVSPQPLFQAAAIVNSETLGSIDDRITVTCLKIHHTEELIFNGKDTKGDFQQRLDILHRQVEFLNNCHRTLHYGLARGTHRMQSFLQLKMYNSADTNPHMK